VCGLQVVGGFGSWLIAMPLSDRPEDPAAWLSPQAATALLLIYVFVPIAYAAASWSPVLGRRSIGKHAFHLRVIRDDR
jgi:hypothetical protein